MVRLETATVTDQIISDGRALVLHGRTVLIVSGLGMRILEHAAAGIDRESLEARLEAEFGTAPDGALDAALSSLIDAGVLTDATAGAPPTHGV